MTNEIVFNKEQQEQIGAVLDERMKIPVSIEVWAQKDSALARPDRDPCVHCDDTVRLARLLSSLHPGLSVTLYDMDRHANRAIEAGVERPPLTILRGRNGRDIRVLGFWTGGLFPAIVDLITFLSSEETPLNDQTKEALAAITNDVPIEVLGAIYDAYSAHMLRLVGAMAVESRHIRFQFTELVEFPTLASAREIEAVPVTLVGGIRFLGAWDEQSLLRQIVHMANGEPAVIARDEQLAVPYYSEADIQRMAEQNEAAAQPQTTPGGLYIPGR